MTTKLVDPKATESKIANARPVENIGVCDFNVDGHGILFTFGLASPAGCTVIFARRRRRAKTFSYVVATLVGGSKLRLDASRTGLISLSPLLLRR